MSIPSYNHSTGGAPLALALLAGAAFAGGSDRWVMSFPSPTKDTTAFERRYGGVSFLNREAGGCSSCRSQLRSISDSTGSFARWEFSNPAAARVDYEDVGGMLFPLDPEWSWNHDLRKSSGLRIKVRSKTRTEFRLGLEGPAAPFASVGVQPEVTFSADSTWRWIQIPWIQFRVNPEIVLRLHDQTVRLTLADSLGRILSAYADFRDRASVATNDPLDPLYASDSANLLGNLRAFKIIPKVTSVVQRAVLDIDSISMEGIAPQWGGFPSNGSCQGAPLVVDRFEPSRGTATTNLLGGAWEAILDSSSANPQAASSGRSTLAGQAREPGTTDIVASLNAQLARIDAKNQPGGGWARLATWLSPSKSPRSVPDLKAVSFRIQAGDGTGNFDTAKIRGVTFRLHSSKVDDSVAFSVRLPYDSIRPRAGESGKTVCIDLDRLRQPGWYTGKAGITSLDPTSLTALSWTLSLDEPNAAEAEASRILLWDATLWTSGTATLDGATLPRPLAARAIEGHLVVESQRGRNLHVQIRGLDGRILLDRSLWATGAPQRIDTPRHPGMLLVSITDGISRTHLRILPR